MVLDTVIEEVTLNSWFVGQEEVIQKRALRRSTAISEKPTYRYRILLMADHPISNPPLTKKRKLTA